MLEEQANSEKDQNGSNYSQYGWLKRIQEQSWEPEILISGIVLFALVQFPPLIRQFDEYLDVYSISAFSNGNVDELLFAVLLTANYWLIAGFTLHLIMRSVWVAFVGLSYVYVNGVDLDRLSYHERYKKILEKNSDYTKSIIKLEKVCSTVFAASFLIFMCTIGAFFFLSVITAFIYILVEVYPPSLYHVDSWAEIIISIMTLVYLIDFIGLGLLKRIPYVSKVYYPIYRLMSFLTLSPLYRNIYYGFISNHKKWKVAVGMIIFVVITFFTAENIRREKNIFNALPIKDFKNDKYQVYHGHYENLMGDDPSKTIQIPADVIESDVLPVFIVMNSGVQESSIVEACNYDSLMSIKGINEDSVKMDCLTAFYGLEIDGDVYEPEFFYHYKQKTAQEGLICYLDISELSRGIHRLNLIFKYSKGDHIRSRVEFYKRSAEIEREKEVIIEKVALPSDSLLNEVQD